MSDTNFDLVVIGGGPAGYTGAIRASQLGLKVACIEKRKTLGGTCLNVGCIPSKALLDSSEHYHHSKHKLQKHGVIIDNVRLDVAAMMQRKDAVVRQLTGGIDGLFKKHKITRYDGYGTLLKGDKGQHKIEIKGSAGNTIIQSPRVLLATGSEPIELPFMKFDGKRIISSTEALTLNEIPKKLIVVGGGYIGLEMSSVWARLGTQVTVVEYMDHLLPMCDQQLAKELHKSLVKLGIDFRLGTKCLGAQASSTGVNVSIEEKDKGKSTLAADYVLVCTGRRPFTDGLGLETVGVKSDEKGRVIIDTHFQTNVAGIWAVGDIVDGPMLAHKAEEEAVAAVELMSGKYGHVNYETIPSVIYTWPELASVGRTEEELKNEGRKYKTGTFPFMANARAKAMDETEGMVKVLADADTDTVLGVHILGPRASDMIAEAVSVMEFGGSAEDIARTCHSHPTLSEAFREAALGVDKRQINL